MYGTSAQSFSNFNKYMGQGELKIPKYSFDLLEFYFSGGKYERFITIKIWLGKKLIKEFNWNGAFVVMSQNGKGYYWYYNSHGTRQIILQTILDKLYKNVENKDMENVLFLQLKIR